MTCCCSPFADAAEQQFSREKATKELADYRRRGAAPTTRLLSDGVAQAGQLEGMLLDVGSGIGALTFELLRRGLTRAVAVDASSAYVVAAREEAARLGCVEAIQFVHGDFMVVAKDLPAAPVVTLDRVVCCYPLYRPLLEEVLRHTGRCFALSYPRDRWYVRLGMAAENAARRLVGNSFRTFVHPADAMEQLIRGSGFSLASRRHTWVWSVDVYVK
ncbi:MAG TPA: class I SAM-dependent methyltransferase [Terriglobales bacterium]|nr:class I SAM-dependent methyltransferase [Terriglobales bacterium]